MGMFETSKMISNFREIRARSKIPGGGLENLVGSKKF